VIRRTALFSCLLAALIGLSGLAYDRSQFLFLDEIRIGMTGVGKTIIAGDRIEEFAVDVLGVIDQPGTLSDFIVVRVSGEVIGRAGGIAQGMSGSPVYVDGKMIGALSRAANWSKAITPIGLVTPIEPMLAVLDDARAVGRTAEPRGDAVLADVRLVDGARPADPAQVAAAPDAIFAHPVGAPLVVTGLSGRALDVLLHGAEGDRPAGTVLDLVPNAILPEIDGLPSQHLSLAPLAVPAAGGRIDPARLEPGSSIGIALATGDITVGALGTLTYREGDAVIGFGHPFLSNGPSAFAMTTVSIVETMKSYEASFKLGTLGETIGTILEDRMPAIGGRIGPLSNWIDLSLAVTDSDRATTATYEVELADEPRLMPELLLATGFEAIDTTLDRIGPGTVEVRYRIDGAGMPRPLERTDVFLSTRDVAVFPPWQLAGIVSVLQYNAFADPQIDAIGAEMAITREIKAVLINDLEIDRLVYTPGESISFRVVLQTYQGETRTEEGTIAIPPDLIADYIAVRAYSGPRTIERGEAPATFEHLADLIDAIEELPSYDTLTVELFAVDPFSAYSDALYGVDKVRIHVPGYVLYGERERSALLGPESGEGGPALDEPGAGW